ncbi:MAG: homocysteine S-methyltransferase family protein [Oscillospiraceae bacterium]|nr:homocysteine S-methyltransferase family protein [Oscillospiraceae bacterium]
MDLLHEFLVFDGAMGTMLQDVLQMGQAPETLNVTHPETVLAVHRQYVQAGADVVTTNTFGANRLKYHGDIPLREVIESGVRTAKASGAKYVALDVGPTGALLEPLGEAKTADVMEAFREQIAIGVAAGADIVLIETMTDLLEAKAALLAAKAVCDKPVFVTMSFQENGRTFLGADAASAALTLASLGASAVGVNCSLGPQELLPAVQTVLQYSAVPVMVQPNAGLPVMQDGKTMYTVTPEAFVQSVSAMMDMGVTIVGGCCGTTPDYIRKLRSAADAGVPKGRVPFKDAAVCSASKCVLLDGRTTVIGERINPTGKKKLKEALRTGDDDYILQEALSQRDAGAQILDVNAGLPDIDETAVLSHLVDELQTVTDLPLQIDSSDPAAVEAAVLRYRGKPIINSVNGKEDNMAAILPLVKKYGTAVVGLTLDESGIPATAEARFAVAEKIVNRAAEYGIPRQDVFIDCLVLTASTNQDMVMETVRAVRMVKERLGCKTVLGVSNVSFGLPERELVNRTFLAAALGAGLDLPILNPCSKAYMDTVDAFRVLHGEDRESKQFIANHHQQSAVPQTACVTDISTLILNGQKAGVRTQVRKLLRDTPPLDIIQKHLIPALDIVGEKFESGVFFLPQLIASAEAAKEGFDEIAAQAGDDKPEGEKILLATVEGDIHDIGKNIVAMLLGNYGYTVVDLGKDVPPERIVQTVQAQNIRLVGLSALMTTTVPSMQKTIEDLRRQTSCVIMVGGAVLTQADADRIGADYYARDAAEAARIAEKVFKGEK